MRPPALLLLLLTGAVVLAGLAPARGGQKIIDHDYVGADRCRACHAEEFAAWQRSPHARAFEALSARDRADPRCLACHTTVPDDVSTGLVGVQCESCHGPGRHYAVDHVMRDRELRAALQLATVDAQTCARCHTDSTPALTTFVYEQKLPLIKHWRDKPGQSP